MASLVDTSARAVHPACLTLVAALVLACTPKETAEATQGSETGTGESTTTPTGTGDPGPLFDERGTWAVFEFDLDGSGEQTVDVTRLDKFLLHYDPDLAIVAAAACLDSMGDSGIDSSLCDLEQFVCRCFDYTFSDTTMVWTEFVPAGNPPPPEPPADSGAPKPGEAHALAVETHPGAMAYRHGPLPYAVFSSDGLVSSHALQRRGDSLFEPTGCREICGITGG